MRDKKLIEDGSVCEGDFMDGVDTVAQHRERMDEREPCRFFPHDCPVLNPGDVGPFCVMKTGQEVARFSSRLGTSVEEELEDFAEQAPMPPNGYFDPTVEQPADATTDRDEVTRRVGVRASEILGIQEIDAQSVHKEFEGTPDDVDTEDPVLAESVFDPETSRWMHHCGTMVAAAEVRHPVRLKAMPLAGPGRVVTEQKPYCPNCSEAPDPDGEPVYEEDKEAAELERIRRVGRRLR
ncbi:MAG TPA: hypothetical protein VIF43_02185 [Patescibacteria group bacterium]|jgi:hypothetical protein